MSFVDFSPAFVADLVARAQSSARRRQHHNVHRDFVEPAQRLFNAIEPDSYIRPHRHLADAKRECLLGMRGRLALIAFQDDGTVERVVAFGAASHDSVGVELDPAQWHTVVALQPGSLLFEVKSGPFDPNAAKDFAPWAPAENTDEAANYLQALVHHAERICSVLG